MTPSPHKVRELRSLYIRQHPLALTISGSAMMAAALLIAVPGLMDDTRIGQITPQWMSDIWLIMFGGGGAAATYGLIRLNPKVESAGMILLAATISVQVLAAIDVAGTSAILGIFIQSAVSIGCFIRAISLHRDFPKHKAIDDECED